MLCLTIAVMQTPPLYLCLLVGSGIGSMRYISPCCLPRCEWGGEWRGGCWEGGASGDHQDAAGGVGGREEGAHAEQRAAERSEAQINQTKAVDTIVCEDLAIRNVHVQQAFEQAQEKFSLHEVLMMFPLQIALVMPCPPFLSPFHATVQDYQNHAISTVATLLIFWCALFRIICHRLPVVTPPSLFWGRILYPISDEML